MRITALTLTQQIIEHYKLPTQIMLTDGFLSDAYLIKKDIVVLSEDVANGRSVADLSVACHEIGHAMQKEDESAWLSIQMLFSFLKKLANFFMPIAFVIGLVLIFIPNYFNIALTLFCVTIGLWIITFLFKIILIPLELNASKRAYNILKDNKLFDKKELKICKKILSAAALTYIGSLFAGLYKIWYKIKKSFRRD